MALSRCPVCDDVLKIGINVKLNQVLICPTCLSSLQVVGLIPLELEIPDRRNTQPGRNRNHLPRKRGTQNAGKSSKHTSFEPDDFEDEYNLDDYQLERRLRHKSDRLNHPEGNE
jgi:lysine biosynthesis protein LysW